MNNWQNGEEGPTCFCGWPTYVVMTDGLANLMCFGHTKAEGAMFPLPKNKPEKWPNMSHEEMQALVEQGVKEHDDGTAA
jgi:hypothetical protein